MTEYVHLIGVEDVQRAGSAMRGAAGQMQTAASSLEDSLFRHRQFLDDWLCHFEKIINEKGGKDES